MKKKLKQLNLSDGFSPYGINGEIDYNFLMFASGEPQIKIKKNWKIKDSIVITTRINSADDMLQLLVAKNAIDNIGGFEDIHLMIPYFPGSRQDRVMTKGEALTVKVYADLINTMEFNSVTILDPHSDVTPALLDNVNVINNHKFVQLCIENISEKPNSIQYNLISPDAGSNKKMKDLVKFLVNVKKPISEGHMLHPDGFFGKGDRLIKCDKTRDVSTGEITGFEVGADDLGGNDCIIVDDICSNGGTFLGLAEELKKRNAGKLYLVVTHGEFGKDIAKTISKLTEVFDCIYTTDSIFDIDETFYEAAFHYKRLSLRNSLIQFKLCQIL